MTWTYSVADLATSEKDQVRLEIGDTDINYQLLQDEEINFALSMERNFWAGAARCCEMITRFFMRKADVRLGRSMMITYTTMAQQYIMMARMLRCKAMGTVAPYVGGASVTDKTNIEQNTDLVQPAFARSMMQNPWVGGYTPDITPPIGGETAIDEEEEF